MESAFGVDHGEVSKALPGLKMPKVGQMLGQQKEQKPKVFKPKILQPKTLKPKTLTPNTRSL